MACDRANLNFPLCFKFPPNNSDLLFSLRRTSLHHEDHLDLLFSSANWGAVEVRHYILLLVWSLAGKRDRSKVRTGISLLHHPERAESPALNILLSGYCKTDLLRIYWPAKLNSVWETTIYEKRLRYQLEVWSRKDVKALMKTFKGWTVGKNTHFWILIANKSQDILAFAAPFSFKSLSLLNPRTLWELNTKSPLIHTLLLGIKLTSSDRIYLILHLRCSSFALCNLEENNKKKAIKTFFTSSQSCCMRETADLFPPSGVLSRQEEAVSLAGRQTLHG